MRPSKARTGFVEAPTHTHKANLSYRSSLTSFRAGSLRHFSTRLGCRYHARVRQNSARGRLNLAGVRPNSGVFRSNVDGLCQLWAASTTCWLCLITFWDILDEIRATVAKFGACSSKFGSIRVGVDLLLGGFGQFWATSTNFAMFGLNLRRSRHARQAPMRRVTCGVLPCGTIKMRNELLQTREPKERFSPRPGRWKEFHSMSTGAAKP